MFFTVGHGENKPNSEEQEITDKLLAFGSYNPHVAYFRNPYPIGKLTSISPDATVAIQGMGLTAYDVIAELTVGRGGRFLAKGLQQLQYEPSGREPQIIIYSRQSIPFSARGVN